MARGGSTQQRGRIACSPLSDAEAMPFGTAVVGESIGLFSGHSTSSTWPGTSASEARAAYQRAREAGISAARALVIGCIASFREGWMFRKNLADHTGLSVRTVQRAITQAKDFGLIGVARAKKNEIPPGMDRPLPCGWSHRWVVGWGQAAAAAKTAIANCRLARIVKAAARATVAKPKTDEAPGPMQGPREQRPPRQWTVAELDAELERLARAKGPSG